VIKIFVVEGNDEADDCCEKMEVVDKVAIANKVGRVKKKKKKKMEFVDELSKDTFVKEKKMKRN
jgi:hypothetical protein